MRDDSERWDAPGAHDMNWTSGGLTIAPGQVTRQTLISGADVLSGTGHPAAGWPDVVTVQTYALSLRRDRILLVNGPATADGWHADTAQAVSDMSDAYSVFEIVGKNACATLKRGSELRLDVPSGSVARLLFGLGVLLYRFEDNDRFRIHVPRAQTEALCISLKAAVPAP